MDDVHLPVTYAATGLDHVGIYAHSMDDITAQFERLGFLLTPLSQHATTDPATGITTRLGTANRCAMLGRGYIELLAIVDANLDPRDLASGLARYAGLHIMAFGTDEPARSVASMRAGGFDAGLGDLRRSVDTPTGRQLARFTQVRVPRAQMPEGLLLTLLHHTPEVLWQPRYLAHPNGATALDALALVVRSPDEIAPRYERYLGTAAARIEGGLRFALPHGSLLILEPDAFSAQFGGATPPLLPFPGGLVVSVNDLGHTRAWLDRSGVAWQQSPDGLHVAAEDAGNAALIFRESPKH